MGNALLGFLSMSFKSLRGDSSPEYGNKKKSCNESFEKQKGRKMKAASSLLTSLNVFACATQALKFNMIKFYRHCMKIHYRSEWWDGKSNQSTVYERSIVAIDGSGIHRTIVFVNKKINRVHLIFFFFFLHFGFFLFSVFLVQRGNLFFSNYFFNLSALLKNMGLTNFRN